MPIKPENKKRYPKNWKQISEYIRFNRAQNKCEVCGVPNYAIGYRHNEKFVPLDCNHILNGYGKGINHETGEMIPYKDAKSMAVYNQ